MDLVVSLAAFLLCSIFYVRMVRRELPEPMAKRKALLPVLFGLAAPLFSTALVIGLGVLVKITIGRPVSEMVSSLVLRSVISAFLSAGFPEELVKLLLALLAVKIVKPRSVYAYALLFAGVGFGFTALEEILYGGGNFMVALIRLPGFAMHMCFQLIMGAHLGLAKYRRASALGGAGRHVLLGLCLPVLWHTVFDAVTISNAALQSENEDLQLVGIIIALAVVLVSVVLQFVLLSRFKKKSAEYSALTLA